MQTTQSGFVPGRIFIPDSEPLPGALQRVTHLGIGAHHDDLEFMAFHGIVECFQKSNEWFAGVTCTDGRGSVRQKDAAPSPGLPDLEVLREAEQNRAAAIGGYAAMVQLAYPSAHVKPPDDRSLCSDLAVILDATRPEIVYAHSPTDKHATHLGVFSATLRAIRSLPFNARPKQLIGCEVWRGLDWLCDREKIRMDVTGYDTLANELNAVFTSQIEGGKRYDLAVIGRRAANATFFEPREQDHANQVLIGVDLTPLIQNDALSVREFTKNLIRRFEEEVDTALARFFPI
jgi:LmbE family N-acetylglucosaminyl deacetylase